MVKEATKMIEVRYANELVHPYIHVFLFGDTGSGKTTAAATFPSPFFILPKNEASILTLRGKAIPYVEVASTSEMDEALTLLERSVAKAKALRDRGDEEGAHAAFPIRTVVVESLTHYCDLVVEEFSDSAGKMNQAQWGKVSVHLRNMHTRLRNLPVHAVFTSLATVKENDVTNAISGGPLMVGSMAYKLPAACDVIGYCEVIQAGDRQIYRTYLSRYKFFSARIRVPEGVTVPPYIDNFRWEKLAPLFGLEGQ
jgi:hypothetical protein